MFPHPYENRRKVMKCENCKLVQDESEVHEYNGVMYCDTCTYADADWETVPPLDLSDIPF
jgi:formylmethanofuran dehydrogenase subunit E